MLNDFDSLNVANAAGIVIYESVKQMLQNSNQSDGSKNKPFVRKQTMYELAKNPKMLYN